MACCACNSCVGPALVHALSRQLLMPASLADTLLSYGPNGGASGNGARKEMMHGVGGLMGR